MLSASQFVDPYHDQEELASSTADHVSSAGRAFHASSRLGAPNKMQALRVMTWNIYLGADFTGLLEALTSGGDLVEEVQEVVTSVLATDFVERADALAEQIATVSPDLIGLQEAVEWSIPTPNFGLVEFDFREIMLAELAKEGMTYEIVADTTQTDVTLAGIGFTDHDIILKRTGSELEINKVQEEHFTTNLQIPLPPELGLGDDLTFLRGWNSVDVGLNGINLRFLNTHLETAQFAEIQTAQTVELLLSATKTHLPIIMVGDFNSSADRGGPNDTLSYEILRLAGFRDVWQRTNPGELSYTCCQEPDLRNETSTLNDRIDFVFSRGAVVSRDADVLGESEADRTETGLWPSDHAGVVADLQLRQRHPWWHPYDRIFSHFTAPTNRNARLDVAQACALELRAHSRSEWRIEDFSSRAYRPTVPAQPATGKTILATTNNVDESLLEMLAGNLLLRWSIDLT